MWTGSCLLTDKDVVISNARDFYIFFKPHNVCIEAANISSGSSTEALSEQMSVEVFFDVIESRRVLVYSRLAN